jgi:deoxyadenosine/deoxycytidine kinase/NTP pyrophosphatase (non-canonical NTP hydrolase)
MVESAREVDLSQQTLPHIWYIVIEGAIGVGKTTLARMLREQFDAGLLLEVFEENPFLSKFYESRAQYAFQTQMFFLLSRYRQQHNIPQMLQQKTILSDYMFAKDWLFAQLNLDGDEWDVYQQIHGALAEQIATPDLIVYLQADTDVLMGRIASRDRPYERDMDREYIESLRQTYERFFATFQSAPTLTIDTNHLDFVTNPADLQSIASQVRNVLQEGLIQGRLPQLTPAPEESAPPTAGRSLADYQRFHSALDSDKGFITDLYFNYLCLSEEMGELGSELAHFWREEARSRVKGMDPEQARREAMSKRRGYLESELADCMAYLLKLANYAGIDLESAYVDKMNTNRSRTWP